MSIYATTFTCQFENLFEMYCYIKYADVLPSRSKEDTGSIKSGSTLSKSVSSRSSLTENKTLLVNPDCFIQILLDYIASEIKFDKERDFDLCDEFGQLLNIPKMKPWHLATDVMKSQKVYYIVMLERDDNGNYKRLDLIINKNSREYFDVVARLRRSLPSARRFSVERKSSRRSAEDRSSRASLRKATRGSLTPDDTRYSNRSLNNRINSSRPKVEDYKKSTSIIIKNKPSSNIKNE